MEHPEITEISDIDFTALSAGFSFEGEDQILEWNLLESPSSSEFDSLSPHSEHSGLSGHESSSSSPYYDPNFNQSLLPTTTTAATTTNIFQFQAQDLNIFQTPTTMFPQGLETQNLSNQQQFVFPVQSQQQPLQPQLHAPLNNLKNSTTTTTKTTTTKAAKAVKLESTPTKTKTQPTTSTKTTKSRKRDRVSEVPDSELSSEQLAKRMRRRERNKVAAQQSRTRKQMKIDELETYVQSLSDENKSLQDFIAQLQSENSSLRGKLQAHGIPDDDITHNTSTYDYSLRGAFQTSSPTLQYIGAALFAVVLVVMVVSSSFSSVPESQFAHERLLKTMNEIDSETSSISIVSNPTKLLASDPKDNLADSDDIIQVFQKLLPKTQFEHRFGAQHLLHSIQYIKQHGQPGTQYIISPEAHSIILLDDSTKELVKVTQTHSLNKNNNNNNHNNNNSNMDENLLSNTGSGSGTIINRLPSRKPSSSVPISVLLPAGIISDNPLIPIHRSASEFSLDNINVCSSSNITRYGKNILSSNFIVEVLDD